MRTSTKFHFLARGAVVSAMAACLSPQIRTDSSGTPPLHLEPASSSHPTTQPHAQHGTDQSVTFAIPSDAKMKWTPAKEREFRRLALEEVRGAINPTESSRLNELERFRNRLMNPQTPEEILMQIKRDRILEKMEIYRRP